MHSNAKREEESRVATEAPAERPLDTSVRAVRVYEQILGLVDQVRRDTILTRLDCPPRMIDDAIRYRETRRKAEAKSQPPTAEPWQLPVVEPPRIEQPAPKPATPDFSPPPPQDKTVRAGMEESPLRRPRGRPKKSGMGRSKQQTARDNATARRIQAALVLNAAPVRPRAVRPATSEECARAKPAMDIAFENIFVFCKTTMTELTSAGEDDQRVNSYRYALILTLDYAGVRPEIVATRLGISNEAAMIEFEAARASLRERNSATQFFTQGLCAARNINFKAFLEHYR